MTTINYPNVNASISGAKTTVAGDEQRVLFVGQQLAAGSATSGDLQEDIQNDNSWDTLFGKKSHVAAAIRAFRKVNDVTTIDAIGLDDNGSAVKATATVTFTGTATADGTLTFYVGSKVNNKYTVAVTSGDTATAVGDALVTAITADTAAVVSAANVTGTVTLTAENGGTIGNDLTIVTSGSVAGVSTALVAFASGATDPSLTGLFDVIGDRRYNTIVWPAEYGTADVKTLLDARFNVDGAVLDGVAIATDVDTYANLVTLGNANNSQSLALIGNETVSGVATQVGGAMAEMSIVISALYAAVRSLRYEVGITLSDIMSTDGFDAFGGPAIAGLAYANTIMSQLPIIPVTLGFTKTEIDGLKAAGVSTVGNNVAGNQVISGELLTTYKTDAGGNPDVSFKYLSYVDTASKIREHIYDNLRSEYRNTRLTAADAPIVANRAMTNANQIKAFIVGLYQELSGDGFVLTQGGDTALQFFKRNLTVTVDQANGTATIAMQVPIITQLREMTVGIQIAFDPTV